MIRILLADDHPVVREGLRGMLSAEPDLEVVGEAANGPQAEALAAELGPDGLDLILMDLRCRAATASSRSPGSARPDCRCGWWC